MDQNEFNRRVSLTSTIGVLLGVAGVSGVLATALIAGHELDKLREHPTYHCDGSATVGYAAPGTPEAAACWIEGEEK